MARKQMKKRRRHRRGRFAILYKVLSMLMICAAIVAAMILFFKVDSIQVEGNQRYESQQIVEVSGVLQGDNLFLLNKYDISRRIYEQLPYVQQVQISRSFPSGLVIEVKEGGAAAAIEQSDGLWLLSSSGKLLEHTGLSTPLHCPKIRGVDLLMPSAGQSFALPEEQTLAREHLLQLVQSLEKHGMSELIKTIDLSSSIRITLTYTDRFSVYIPWGSDMDYKVRYLATVVERLESNERGIIDLMSEAEAHFYY